MLFGLHLRALLATVAVLLVLGILMDFFESSRYLSSVEGTAVDIFWFYLLKIPPLLHLLLPISLLVAVSVVFAKLGRGLELRAAAAGGIGPVSLSVSALALGSVVVLLTVLLGELLVPAALDRAEVLMTEKFGLMDSSWRFYRKHHWYQGEGQRVFKVGASTDQGRALRNVTLLELDENFHVRRRSEFNRVHWQHDHFVANGLAEREFDQGRLLSLQRSRQKTLDWPEGPAHFRDLRGRPKQKTLAQLSWTIDEMERRGLDAARYRLERHQRLAFPLLGLVLLVLTLPWLVLPTQRRSAAAALIQAVLLVFAAYFLVALFSTAATTGMLIPILGAWLPPLIFMLAAAPKWVSLLKKS